MRLPQLPLLALTAMIGTGNLSADWLQFRGPNGNGYVKGNRNLPTGLNEESVAWKKSLPGRGLGSPIVAGNRVFVTAASGPDQTRLQVLCFSSKDDLVQGALFCFDPFIRAASFQSIGNFHKSISIVEVATLHSDQVQCFRPTCFPQLPSHPCICLLAFS